MAIDIPPSGMIHGHAFRLKPEDSLKDKLCETAQIIFAQISEDECSSLFMMTAVGSLKDVTLRLANASRKEDQEKNEIGQIENQSSSGNDIKRWENQRFEIVSLVGTFSRDGSCHLHLSISDAEGNTFGGHLMAGIVFTTCEIVLGSIQGVTFPRELDDRTGYKELLPKQIHREQNWLFKGDTVVKATFFIILGYSMHYISTPFRKQR